MRLRRSGTRNTLDNFSSIELEPLLPVTSCQLPVVSYQLVHDRQPPTTSRNNKSQNSAVGGQYQQVRINWLPTTSSVSMRNTVATTGNWLLATDYFDLAAGFFDLLLGRLGKLVGMYSDRLDRKSTRLNSSHLVISYAVFCLKKKKHR